MAGEALPLSDEVQNGSPCILNFFSERSLGVARSSLIPELSQWFMPKGLCVASYQSQHLTVRVLSRTSTETDLQS